MHEILSEREDSKDSELSDEDGSKGLPQNKNGDSCSHKVFHQKVGIPNYLMMMMWGTTIW
jgi:hypothetical protein